MNQQKVALLVDTGMDVPQEFVDRYHMHVIPLKVIYHDREYNDRFDITPQEVYDRLEEEIPKTSLPDSATVLSTFERILREGYQTVLCITISGALSGTNNFIRLLSESFHQLKFRMIDTKNIGIGAGFQAIFAGQLLEAGLALDAVYEKITQSVKESKIFFCLSTLEYLAKGGRIGKVAAMLGSLLNLKPIITCNAEGAYVVASKVRGRAQSIAETINLAVNEARRHARYTIAVVQGNAKEEAKRVIEEVRRRLPGCGDIMESEVSPALVVHTGPGLIGIGVHAIG